MSVSKLPIVLLAALTVSCDDNGTETNTPVDFTVRIENVSTVYSYIASGVFNTPVGGAMPGPIGPGAMYEFSFDAAPGSALSFATMFVHSNDFFYAPDGAGIALYDGTGQATTGDLTSQIQLWDSGSEINQEPGLGPDQAPRQAGPDIGAADPDNTVRLAPDDFANLPAVSDVIQVTIAHDGNTRFTVQVINVSTATTLATSDMNTTAVPLAPGVWVVHNTDAPLFDPGMPDFGDGLAALAEDGDATGLGTALETITGFTSPLAPGVWAVHAAGGALFSTNMPDHGDGLEELAEDGDPSTLAASLATDPNIEGSGVFNTPEGAGIPSPIMPGEAYTFTLTATLGMRLSLATMLAQSNDLFYSPGETGVALFDLMENPISGDITSMFSLWDAGTEVNEVPGIGLNQAPRQSGPNVGPVESGVVRLEDDAFTYPATANVIRVTIIPQS